MSEDEPKRWTELGKVEVDAWDVTDDDTGMEYTVRMTTDRSFVTCTCVTVERDHMTCPHIKALFKYLRRTDGYPEWPTSKKVN